MKKQNKKDLICWLKQGLGKFIKTTNKKQKRFILDKKK